MRDETRKRLTLAAMSLGTFIAILDTSIVNLGLHTIQTQLGASVATLQWIVDLYNVTYAAFILTGGTLGDLYGRRRVFIAGVSIFAAGSIVCALAPSPWVLVAGRGIAGLGAALQLPGSLAILNVTFRGDERTRAIAIWASANGLGMGIGPTVGGVLIAWLGWRSLFYLMVPFAAAAVVLARLAVPESADPAGRRLDLPGQVLAALALVALSVGLIQGPSWGWGSPATVGALAVAALALAGFLARERSAPAPMVPLSVFSSRAFSVAMADATLMTFGMYAFLFIFPLYLQSARGASTVTAGLVLLPMSATFFLVSSFLTGRLVVRFGPRLVIGAGMALAAIGLLLLTGATARTGYPVLAVALTAIGVGLGLITGPIPNVAVANAPAARSGMSSGVVNVGRMLGATLGVAILGSLIGPRGARSLSGMPVAYAIGALAELLGAALALTFLRRDSLRRV